MADIDCFAEAKWQRHSLGDGTRPELIPFGSTVWYILDFYNLLNPFN